MTAEEYLNQHCKPEDWNNLEECLKDSILTNNVIEHMERYAALRIHDVVGSASFQKAIKDAIEYGKGHDYGYNGEDEFCFDTFNSDRSMQEVIKVLKEHFL